MRAFALVQILFLQLFQSFISLATVLFVVIVIVIAASVCSLFRAKQKRTVNGKHWSICDPKYTRMSYERGQTQTHTHIPITHYHYPTTLFPQHILHGGRTEKFDSTKCYFPFLRKKNDVMKRRKKNNIEIEFVCVT